MFTGYSDKTVDFFWDIRFNNSREWFHPRKDQFNEYIMIPTKELSGELYDWLTENYPQLNLNLHISKIYRDARRLFGRGPLKDHIWFSFQNELEGRENAPCLWFGNTPTSTRRSSRSWQGSSTGSRHFSCAATNTQDRRDIRTTRSPAGTTAARSPSPASANTTSCLIQEICWTQSKQATNF